MSISFANVKAITIPEGSVKLITDSAGAIIWGKTVLYQYERDVYVWKKYTENSVPVIHEDEPGTYYSYTNIIPKSYDTTITAYKAVQLDGNGKIVGVDKWTEQWTNYATDNSGNAWREYPYFKPDSFELDTSSTITSGWIRVHEFTADATYSAYYVAKCLSVYVSHNYSKGDYIGEVTATSKSAHPTNGREDGYWYVYDRAYTETVESEYRLAEGASTSLTFGGLSTTVDGYASIWVGESGEIHGNGDVYTNAWRQYYKTFLSTYPYIYYMGDWYKITAATSTKATVLPLSTIKE